jgi:2,3-dihydroxyphenylpropionate 1,2-dioxygenase
MSIVGAMATVHAPQLIDPPPTEDPEQVRLTIEAMERIGRRLDELRAEVVLLIVGDHLEGFFLNCVAPFTLHAAEYAEGTFNDRHWRYPIATELSLDLLRLGQEAGFDLAFSQDAELDHASLVPLHHIVAQRQIPIVPLFVNVYVPPQPSPRRCFQLGQALRSILQQRPERVVVLASGGMSHFPGTERYGEPDFDFDYQLLEALRAGQGERLLELSPLKLDQTGNIELRTWMVATGIVGAEAPFELYTYQPSWHHGYAVGEWQLQSPVGAGR